MEYGHDSPLLEDNKLSSVGKVHYRVLKNEYAKYANLPPNRRQFLKTKWPYVNEPDSIFWTPQEAESFSTAFISQNMKDIINYDSSGVDFVREIFELSDQDPEEWENMLTDHATAMPLHTKPDEHDIHAVWVAFMFFTGRADLKAGAEDREDEELFGAQPPQRWATPRYP
jgi:hypothetical protein